LEKATPSYAMCEPYILNPFIDQGRLIDDLRSEWSATQKLQGGSLKAPVLQGGEGYERIRRVDGGEVLPVG
jgi:hypothetical protein